MIPVLLAIALQGSSIVDQGVLVVRHDTNEVGREHFRLVAGRGGAGPGWTLTTTVRYDRVRPAVELAPILEIGRDSSPTTLQYDVAYRGGRLRILGEAGPGRFTIRVLAQATERAREYPASRATVVLDDSVFAPYVLAAWRARSTPHTLSAIVPRSLRTESVTVEYRGEEATTVLDARVTLQHVTVHGGPNQVVHVWRDSGGRLMKVEIPSRRLSAERTPDS